MRGRAEAPTLDRVVARRIRELRQGVGWTQDELAGRLRDHGFRDWTRAVVAAAESGRRRLVLADVLALGMVFRCPVSHFVVTRQPRVRLHGGVTIGTRQLRQLLSGGGPRHLGGPAVGLEKPEAPRRWDARTIREVRQWLMLNLRGSERSRILLTPGSGKAHTLFALLDSSARGELERYAARRLRADPHLVALASFGLWGRSATAEREHRARERPRAKQHVSRDVLREIGQALDRLNDEKLVAEVKAGHRGASSREGGRREPPVPAAEGAPRAGRKRNERRGV